MKWKECTCKSVFIAVLLVSAIYIAIIWYFVNRSCQLSPTIETQSKISKSMRALKSIDFSSSKNVGDLLLVMVISAPGNRDRRDIIRRTWRNSYVEQGKTFTVKFVIGTKNLKAEVLEALAAENEQNKDLVLLADHFESYHNLTRKVLQLFIWAAKTAYSYVLKTDDDSFLKLDQIESELKQRTSSKGLYWGHITPSNTVTKKGKWKESNWFLCNKYLPYALGGGYILSMDLVHRIVVNADALTIYSNEDVSVGVWTSAFDIERKNDQRFSSTRKSFDTKKCPEYLLSHHLTPKDMRIAHRSMSSKGTLC